MTDGGKKCALRQKWEPVSYQAGELSHTQTLAPKESRKFSTKTVIKKKRFEKEIEKSLFSRRQESDQKSRAETEILRKAESNTNFKTNSQNNINYGVYGGTHTVDFGGDASKTSHEVKKSFREEVFKAAEIKAKLTPKKWNKRRAGVTKRIYNLMERRNALLWKRAFPDAVYLYDMKVIGLTDKSPFSRPSRIYDTVQIKNEFAQPAEIKSPKVVPSNVKGGLSNDDILVHFREKSSIGKQIKKEKSLIKRARRSGSKIILEGRDVITNSVIRIEIKPQNLEISRIVRYDELPDKHLLIRKDGIPKKKFDKATKNTGVTEESRARDEKKRKERQKRGKEGVNVNKQQKEPHVAKRLQHHKSDLRNNHVPLIQILPSNLKKTKLKVPKRRINRFIVSAKHKIGGTIKFVSLRNILKFWSSYCI